MVYIGKDILDVILNFLRGGVAYFYLVRMVLGGSIGAAEFLLYFSAINGFTSWVEGILAGMAELHRQSLDISRIREFLEYKEPFLFDEGEKLAVVGLTDAAITGTLRQCFRNFP